MVFRRIKAVRKNLILLGTSTFVPRCFRSGERVRDQAVAVFAMAWRSRASISKSRILYFWIFPESVAGN